jgi:hypothetical protein
VREVEGANLFFPEEMPDVIAEEALKLWGYPPLLFAKVFIRGNLALDLLCKVLKRRGLTPKS